MDFDINYLRQAFDVEATMSGKYGGVQDKIRDKYPTALYVHIRHIIHIRHTYI